MCVGYITYNVKTDELDMYCVDCGTDVEDAKPLYECHDDCIDWYGCCEVCGRSFYGSEASPDFDTEYR